MARLVYIGDEISAAGYRLAGITVHSPSEEDCLAVFRQSLADSDLVLLSVERARQLPADEVREASSGLRPLVMIVPDLRQRFTLRDLNDRICTELGVHP